MTEPDDYQEYLNQEYLNYNITYENIFNDEMDYLDSDKENDKYYIGVCKYFPQEKYIMMLCTVTPMSFLKYPIETVRWYLRDYSTVNIKKPKINIMKLHISPHDDSYRVIIKTHWLRLVQRHWKKVYKQRCEIVQQMKSTKYIYSFALSFRPRSYGMPGLRGMMNSYCQSTCQKSLNTRTD